MKTNFVIGNRKTLLIIFIPLFCVTIYPIFGYLKTTLSIAKYSEKNGVYPTLDEAFIALKIKYDKDFTDISNYVVQKRVDRASYPFIWYVINKMKTDPKTGEPVKGTGGGSFFIHTKDGWIYHPETWSLALGDMGYWMKVFKLYGGEP